MEWPKAQLASLCEVFTDGDWIESKSQSPEGVRLIQTGNVGEGNFKDRRDKSRFISEETFDDLKCCEIFEGDCLVSRLPDPVGRSCILPKSEDRMITAVDCTILRFKKDKLTPEFFNYFSQSLLYLNTVESLTSGATRKRISRKNLGLVEIPTPPIPEQKRIVAILDQAFSDIEQARAKTEQNLKNARELFESYLQQVFSQRGEGWSVSRLSDLCEITSKLIDPKEEEYLDLPHVGAGNIVSSTGGLIKVKTAREEGLISSKFMFDESMVLYSKIRPYLMKVCRPDFIGLCSADVYPLSPIAGILDKDYLFYVLLGKDFTDYAISGSGRAGMPKVNRTHLFNYTVSVPAVEKQREYVTTINQIAAQTQVLENLYSEKLIKLNELKKSILQKAFSGELTKASDNKSNEGAAA